MIDFSKILNESINPPIWYHGSEHKFDKFDSFENFESSGPSALGIFVSDSKDFASFFGEYIYEVNIKSKNPYTISADKWDKIRLKHAKDTAYFKNLKEELQSKGYDSLMVAERNTQFAGTSVRDPKIIALFDKSQIEMNENLDK